MHCHCWAIPTTAGTGSEATRFAVIYYQGNKQSVAHPSCVPGWVLMEPELLESLPMYQRKPPCWMRSVMRQSHSGL